ncbi:hypothetical protein (mitochondrion) [Myxobolus squamalis]|uniref:Uncharacterized protein n=1 Tax=Myxobolus squamalis TaxID=59785 RepID=A0A678XDG5_MYXSQ|nr:hypothetical protein [Myxobolus squamalis]
MLKKILFILSILIQIIFPFLIIINFNLLWVLIHSIISKSLIIFLFSLVILPKSLKGSDKLKNYFIYYFIMEVTCEIIIILGYIYSINYILPIIILCKLGVPPFHYFYEGLVKDINNLLPGTGGRLIIITLIISNKLWVLTLSSIIPQSESILIFTIISITLLFLHYWKNTIEIVIASFIISNSFIIIMSLFLSILEIYIYIVVTCIIQYHILSLLNKTNEKKLFNLLIILNGNPISGLGWIKFIIILLEFGNAGILLSFILSLITITYLLIPLYIFKNISQSIQQLGIHFSTHLIMVIIGLLLLGDLQAPNICNSINHDLDIGEEFNKIELIEKEEELCEISKIRKNNFMILEIGASNIIKNKLHITEEIYFQEDETREINFILDSSIGISCYTTILEINSYEDTKDIPEIEDTLINEIENKLLPIILPLRGVEDMELIEGGTLNYLDMEVSKLLKLN